MAAAAMVVAACGSEVTDRNEDEGQERLVEEAARAEASPTPTPEDEGQIPQAGEPPSLDGLVSDDELEVAQAMSDYYSWLFRTPNTEPELIAEIVSPEAATDVYERQHQLLTHYFENELWWTGGASELLDVEVIEEQGPNVRHVRIYYRRAEPMELVGSDGEIHNERKPRQWWSEEVWIREAADAPWRVAGLGQSHDVED